MGDRVAVIKQGRLQQVDTPQVLYDAPVNLFVGGVHRLAGDEHGRGDRRARRTAPARSRSATSACACPTSVASRRPGSGATSRAGRSCSGIRPEDIEDAADRQRRAGRPAVPHDRGAAGGARLRGARALRPSTRRRCSPRTREELARDTGVHDGCTQRRSGTTSTFVARLGPRTEARKRRADRARRRHDAPALLRSRRPDSASTASALRPERKEAPMHRKRWSRGSRSSRP